MHRCRTGEEATISSLINRSVKGANSELSHLENEGASLTKFMPIYLEDAHYSDQLSQANNISLVSPEK